MILKLTFYDFNFEIYQHWLNDPEYGLFWQQLHVHLKGMYSLQLSDTEVYKCHLGQAG